MFYLPALLIVTAAGAAPTHPDLSGAVDVYRCDFEPSADANFDHWPDNWQRRTGPGFPHFVEIAIESDRNTQSSATDGSTDPADSQQRAGACLRVGLDGGAATVFSPQIPVSPLFSYVFAGLVKTENLEHNEAYFTVDFFDADGQLVDTHATGRIGGSQDWTQLTIGSMLYIHPQSHTARIGLHVHPAAEESDLFGSVQFDDVVLARLPRMTVTANRPHHLFSGTDNIRITCKISGIPESQPRLRFELIDVAGQVVDQWDHTPSLTVEAESAVDRRPLPGAGSLSGNQVAASRVGYVGEATWRPTFPPTAAGDAAGPGYYQVRVALEAGEGLRLERETALAVVEPAGMIAAGDFGWSLQAVDEMQDVKSLAALLEQVGVSWVKYPVWFAADDESRAAQITWLAERMRTLNVEFVGILDQPPSSGMPSSTGGAAGPVAMAFLEPELWQPALAPVITRLSQLVRWWQLGADNDTSFVDLPNAAEKLQQIQEETTRAGQGIDVGLAWSWLHDSPERSAMEQALPLRRPPYRFLAYTATPQLTAEELRQYLSAARPHQARTWLSLQPLPRDSYSLQDSIHDLLMRIASAKTEGADVIFISDPFSPQHALMNDDGSPGPLLLPFRTTVQTLGGARYEGRLTLPEGGLNYVFSRGGEAMMFIWSETQRTESLYWEQPVRHIDVWGRELPVEVKTVGGRVCQNIQIGTTPTFVTGLNLPIARCCIALNFDNEGLENIFGRSQTLACNFANAFRQGIAGTIALDAPPEWRVNQRVAEFQAPPQENQTANFQVMLRPDATTGPQMLRLDFDVSADRQYRFSVFRTLEVGGGDVSINLRTRLDANGRLIVEQQMINNNEQPVSFNCLLSAPQRRRLRERVVNLRRGEATTVFVYPDGNDLIGKTLWLRAEEIRGERILNYHIVAEP